MVHEGEGVVIPSVKDDKRFNPAVDQFEASKCGQWRWRRSMPRDESVASCRPSTRGPVDFDPDALLVMAGIGNLAGTTIQHAQLFEQLQAAHQRYRELFDDSVDPIFVTGWDGKIHEANRQAALISGYNPKQLQGMLIDKLHEVTRGDKNISMDKLKGDETLSYEAVLKSNTGQTIPIQVQVKKVVFEEAEMLQWMMRDITERKDLDALRDDMTSMIYHDLRSPVGQYRFEPGCPVGIEYGWRK